MAQSTLRAWLQALRVPGFRNPRPVVAIVRLAGVIGARTGGFQIGIQSSALQDSLERAFTMGGVVAVALAINSPGGAPAQASLIAKRIRALARDNEVPVYAFCEDVAASGGYMLACAADEIFADETSIVGSIGVISAGFGFPELLRRYGIERRVYTAGENKGMLDPFRPEQADEVAHLAGLQRDVHETFKAFVRTRRAGKLKGEEAELFSGAFWTGRQALSLGLIDGIAEINEAMRARHGERVRFRPVGPRESWLRRRFGLGTLADTLLGALEERLARARYGL